MLDRRGRQQPPLELHRGSGHATDAHLTDSGFSGILTYWPSEFSQIRGQYRYTKYAEGITANELLFQLQFSIGAHGAHTF